MQVWWAVVKLSDAGEIPTTNALSAKCGMTYTTINMHLKRLREAGILIPPSYWYRGVKLKRRPDLPEQ
jgi:DNA-binding transcriptional ArsR family regulator